MKRLRKYIHATIDVRLPYGQRRDDRRGMALLACLMLTIVVGLLLGAAFTSLNMQLVESQARERSQDSFYTAEAGLERAVFELRQNSRWRPVPDLSAPLLLELADPGSIVGTYTVTVADAPALPGGWPSVWVRSTGVDTAGLFPRTILARVVVQNPANFLAFTLGQLTVLGGITQTGNLLARDINFLLNASEPPGPTHDVVINGNVEYMRTVNSNVPINPASGITITGETRQAPAIPFTGVDLSYYTTLASSGGHLEAGDFSYSGELSRTALAAPNGVVLVEGDLHLSGQLTDNMIFIASGDIYIEGDITAASGPTPPQVGLLAGGDVIISRGVPADLTVEAFILADGGRFRTESGGLPKNSLNFRGAVAARGDSAGVAIDLSVFPLRNVVYNPELVNNSQIPFLPFIVSVVRWQETEPGATFPP